MSRSSTTEVSVSRGGCITIVLGFMALWALIFGVTIDDKHYGVAGCSCDRGLEIDR
jgi:hypothetical protein